MSKDEGVGGLKLKLQATERMQRTASFKVKVCKILDGVRHSSTSRFRGVMKPHWKAFLACLFASSMSLVGCSSVVRHHPSPPGSVAAKLERAGENYQATEAAPAYRHERPH
jgi:hypothetical protein